MDRSVSALKKRVEYLQSVEGDEHTYDHPRTVTTTLPPPPSSPLSPSSHTPFETETHSSETTNSVQKKRRGSVGTMHCDMVVDYEKAVKTTGLLVGLVERIIGRLESKNALLCERSRLIEQFWNESSILSEWLVKMRLELKGKRGGVSDNNQVRGSSIIIITIIIISFYFYFLYSP